MNRVDRFGAALLGRHVPAGAAGADADAALGSALVRDSHGPQAHGPQAMETPSIRQLAVRYRGPVQAELFRAPGALRVLQTDPDEAESPPSLPVATGVETKRTRELGQRQRLGVRR